MPQAEYDVVRPRSNMTTSSCSPRLSASFFACEAALPPAASPPITTSRVPMPPTVGEPGSAHLLDAVRVPAGELLVDAGVAVHPARRAGRQRTADLRRRAQGEHLVRHLHARRHQAARADQRAAADPGAVLHGGA